MKYVIPILMGAVGFLVGIGTAYAQANELFRDHPHAAFYCYGLASLIFIAAIILGWREAAKERRAIGANFSVTIEDLAKEPVDRKKGPIPTHVFVHARVELKSPSSAKVTNYQLQLFKHGQCESMNAEQPNDVEKWEPLEWAFTPPRKFAFRPITHELKRGEPVEGWLRFVSETPALTITSCGVRLIVQTKHGSDFGEIAANPAMWNRNTLTINRKGTA